MPRRGGRGSLDALAEMLDRRLLSLAPGERSKLNAYALMKAGTGFAKLLVRDPLAAYRVLLEAEQGSRRHARLLLSRLLVGLVGGVEEVEAALDALEAGDPGPLRRLMEEAAWRLGG